MGQLPQVSPKCGAFVVMPKLTQRFLLNLSYTLPCEVKTLTDLFKSERVFAANSKVQADNFSFAFCQFRKRALNFNLQGLTHQLIVRIGNLFVFKHVKKPVIFSLCKRCIHREMSSAYFSVSATSDTVISRLSASSAADGTRSYSCSSFESSLPILFNAPTLFRGSRTIRLCSASACKIDCRIHQTA